jgi:predicted Co/Zn/Cd cation transporter (cation efflux family)
MASLDPNEAIAALPVAARHALFQAALRTDFYSFVQAAFPVVSGGKHLQPNWHLEAMAYALSDAIVITTAASAIFCIRNEKTRLLSMN